MMNLKKILGFKWYAGFASLLAGCCIFTSVIGWSYWETQPEKWKPDGQQHKEGGSGLGHRYGHSHYFHSNHYYHK